MDNILKDYTVLIIGPGGSGKDTLANVLTCEPYGLKNIVRYTSRNPRVYEKDGIDYNFISHDEYLSLRDNKKFIFFSEYNMIDNGKTLNVGYGTKISDFNRGTVSIASMKEFLNMYSIYEDIYLVARHVLVVFLYVDKNTRIQSMTKRLDDEAEIIRRVNDDDMWCKKYLNIFTKSAYFKCRRRNCIFLPNLSFEHSAEEISEMIYKLINDDSQTLYDHFNYSKHILLDWNNKKG